MINIGRILKDIALVNNLTIGVVNYEHNGLSRATNNFSNNKQW